MQAFFKGRFLLFLVLGFSIRILLAPITYHSDLLAYDFAREVLFTGNVSTFYDYLPNLSNDNPLLKIYPSNQFNYPPAVYFFLGTTTFLTTFLIDQTFHQQFLFNIVTAIKNPLIFLHLFLLKFQFFFFDFGTAVLLTKLVHDNRKKLLVFAAWMLNPISIYASYMMGQFDIIPVFFTVLSLVLLQKYTGQSRIKWLYFSAVALGVGAAFKIWPLLLLPVLAFIADKWKDRILVGVTGIAVYILPILPFLGSSGFRSTALVANQTQKSLFAQIPVSGGESILLFVVSMVFFYLVYLYRRGSIDLIWSRYMSILFIFLIFTHFHPQWFLWITPFLVLELVLNKGKHLVSILLLLLSVKGMIFLFEPGLNINLFVPLFPSLYDGPSLFQLIGLPLDVNYFRSIFHSLLVANALYFLYYYFPQKETG